MWLVFWPYLAVITRPSMKKTIIITPPATKATQTLTPGGRRTPTGRNAFPPPPTQQQVEERMLGQDYNDRLGLNPLLILAATLQTAGCLMIMRMFKPSWGMLMFIVITAGTVFAPLIWNQIKLRKIYRRLAAA